MDIPWPRRFQRRRHDAAERKTRPAKDTPPSSVLRADATRQNHRSRPFSRSYASSPFAARVRGASLVAARLSAILGDPKVAALPRDARILVYCWRGGDRSGSLAHALSRVGWHVALLEGGYKAYRARVREALYEDAAGPLMANCVAVGGPTGSAKGKVLEALARAGAQTVDLERLANHRGSILGSEPDGSAQPSQKGFESALSFRRADLPRMNRGGAAAGDAEIPRRRVAATPRAPRGSSEATTSGRGHARARGEVNRTCRLG